MNELAPEAYLDIFLRVHSTVGARLSQQFAEQGAIAPSEARVLTLLSRTAQRRMRIDELSQEMGVTKSGVSRIVDRLEKSGYIERQTSHLDRRAIYATMTPGGRDALRHVTMVFRSVFEDVFLSGLSKDDLQQLFILLGRLDQANRSASIAPNVEAQVPSLD